jgi:hypothetical protein
MPGPVETDLFLTTVSAVIVGGLALAGVLWRRQDRLETSVKSVDEKVQAVAQQAATRHDTGLGDVWQALEDHRTESRRVAADAEKLSREFREATLRQLGAIEATLARLEARLPPPIMRAGG